ncbi:MAG: SpoIIE family protein phosphatase [Gemmatimonadetes bacterium]|nr:SpoIIE family protein phosphatase [Gemmatimonadota bacterium]
MSQERTGARKAKILIVDDNPTNLQILMQVLEAADYSVLAATGGARALQVAAQGVPDLVLLDVMMPEMDGYEVCRRLKQNPKTQAIPVIFITANDQTEGMLAGFDAGGVDYIAKPFRQEEVRARVQAQLELHWLTRELEKKNATLERTNRELKETHEKLEQMQRQLIDELEEELQTAHDMQMSLMPTTSPDIQGFTMSGRCLPANHVGGDFYQFFSRNGRLSICLADVTGHAMEAAIPVVMFNGILESQMEQGSNLEDLFLRLNRSMYRTRMNSRTFVCFSMGEIELETRIMRLANGGCPYPLHFRAGTGQVTELQVEAYPLGVREKTNYPIIEVQLEPNDRIVFCSDGAAEAVNRRNELFSFEQMMEIIGEGCRNGLSAGALIDGVIGEVQAFTGEVPQGDDITLVVLEVES